MKFEEKEKKTRNALWRQTSNVLGIGVAPSCSRHRDLSNATLEGGVW